MVSGARRVSEELGRRQTGWRWSSSQAIMLQIYIPKAIEQRCWMCTLGRTQAGLLPVSGVPFPPSRENHFHRVSLSLFLSLVLSTPFSTFLPFCERHTVRRYSSLFRQSPIDNQFFIPFRASSSSSSFSRATVVFHRRRRRRLLLGPLAFAPVLSPVEQRRRKKWIGDNGDNLISSANWICNADVFLASISRY